MSTAAIMARTAPKPVYAAVLDERAPSRPLRGSPGRPASPARECYRFRWLARGRRRPASVWRSLVCILSMLSCEWLVSRFLRMRAALMMEHRRWLSTLSLLPVPPSFAVGSGGLAPFLISIHTAPDPGILWARTQAAER